MKLTIEIAIYVLLALHSTCNVFAQAPRKAVETTAVKPTAAEPTVDQILERHIEAVGGKAALEKISSRVTKGAFEVSGQGLKGEIEIYAKAPNKLLTIQNITGLGLIQDGYDGKTAWSQNPMTGLREKSGAELAMILRAADFYATLNTKRNYSKLEMKGKEKVGGRETWVVLATPAEGAPVKMYYDAQTGLLAKTDAEFESPEGKFPVESIVEDYREVDGVKLPFTLRQGSAVASTVVKFAEVKSNVPIEDAKFTKPAAK